MSEKALSGITVLDMTQFLAGPVCTLSLGMMGADVIKIERPEVGEQGRSDNHKYVYGEKNIKWAILHSNKRSISLDTKTEEGKAILEKLIKKADILVENFALGTIERMGFGYDKIKEMNPRLIMCQIKGYSDYSPYRNFPAMDGPVQCTGGVAAQTGLPDSPPVVSNIALADAPTGDYALAGILAALYQREKTGRGQLVRVNMQEVLLAYGRASFTNQTTPSKRGGAMLFAGRQAPRGMFRCKPAFEGDEDNYAFIMVRDTPGQKQWRAFTDAIGRPELFEDPRFIDGNHRLDNVEQTNAIVNEWTMQHDKKEVMSILCKAGLPTGAVLTIPDICQSPDMYESGFLVKYTDSTMGEITVPSSAIHLSDSPVEMFESPNLGDANEEVYKGILGMTDEELADLKAKKVI